MARQFDVVVERDSEGFFVASVPALSGCHTQARSPGELVERIKEAIALFIDVQEAGLNESSLVGNQSVSAKSYLIKKAGEQISRLDSFPATQGQSCASDRSTLMETASLQTPRSRNER